MRIRGDCHPHTSVFLWECGCPFACDWQCMCNVYTTDQGHSLSGGETCADVQTAGGLVVAASEPLARRIATYGSDRDVRTRSPILPKPLWQDDSMGKLDSSVGRRRPGVADTTPYLTPMTSTV
jgi:hypothetical protein